jgi:hypothetical protein
MKGISCRSCEARIEGRPSFCARCGEPTQFATAEERTQHDLEKWRNRTQAEQASVLRTPASVMHAMGGALPEQDISPTREDRHAPRVTRRRPRREIPAVIARAKEDLPARMKKARSIRRGGVRTEPAHVIDLEHDALSAPAACVRCDRTDWLVRTGQNEDGSFRYWCLRCSRAFKSDLRITHARKPFVVSGSILALLILLANFH